MSFRWTVWIPIVAISLVASIEDAAAQPDVSDQPLIFHTGFEAADDVNYDRWPDGWKRRRGYGYPAYLKIGIDDDPTDRSKRPNRALRLQLDGGAAAVFSPPIAISPLFSYQLGARIRTSGLKHDIAYVSLLFRDAQGKTLQTTHSDVMRGDHDWSDVAIGPITPTDRRTRFAVIVLHLRPDDGHDLRGEAWFDDVRFARLPRMVLQLNSRTHIFDEKAPVRVTCELSGTGSTLPRILFELFDVDGTALARVAKQLDGDAFDTAEEMGGATTRDYAGRSTWDVPIERRGFYRIRVSLQGDQQAILMREATLAVVDDAIPGISGEFGWSLPRGGSPFSMKELAQFLPQMGIHWVKFPCWFGVDEQDRAERLAWFAERLAARNVQLVGVLDEPPPELRKRLNDRQRLSIAAVFLDDQLWHQSIDAVMVRLSLKVRWWQLGRDDDFSFVNFPQLAVKIRQLKTRFDQYGQKTRVGVNWKWLTAPPVAADPPWAFLTLDEAIPLTPLELATYLDAATKVRVPCWVMLRPLSRHEYDLETRVRDLVQRMIVAKVHRADVIMASDPFDRETGLFSPDGQPSELLLPWRTVAERLAGATYLGQLQLPNGSRNFVFERDGEAVMVVWHDTPQQERLYLGDNVRQFDLWGRSVEVVTQRDSKDRPRQIIDVGPIPTVVAGMNVNVARWRLAFRFDTERLASIFGREQRVRFRFRNGFDIGATGQIDFDLPSEWQSPMRRLRFKLSPEEETSSEIPILLGASATNGEKTIGIDVDVFADRRFRFRIFRKLEVGLGDVHSEVTTHIDEHGRIIVEQHLQNDGSDPVSFNCLLFAPGRRRLRQHVFQLQQGRVTVRFVLPHGEDLIGKRIWVRAEEIGGNRLLNYHVTVDP